MANLADSYARDNGGATWVNIQGWLRDGATLHAPIGYYEPNPFGLHEVHGNVFEWCRDSFEQGFYFVSPVVDPVSRITNTPLRTFRGGSFTATSDAARSTMRQGAARTSANASLGLRPASPVK